MILPNGVNIPMPRPSGGNPPVITRTPQGEGAKGELITVHLVGEIGPLTQYVELLEVLDTSTENDIVDIRIDTPGGDVYTTANIVERMENCRAKVITTASGLVASAGTFIWFFGEERRVSRWSKFMFHCSSHADFGRSLSILETSEKLVKYMKGLGLEMLGSGLLTKEEYVAAFENKADVELSSATVQKRINGMIVDAKKAELFAHMAKTFLADAETPVDPNAAPAAPAAPVEPAAPAAPAAPVEPAAVPAEPAPAAPAAPVVDPNAPTAKCGGAKKKTIKKRVVKADGTVEIVEEPAPETPAVAPAPAAPAAPVEPAPAAPAAPVEPVAPAAPVEPAAAPAEPAPASEEPVLDIAKIYADEEVPADPAAAPAVAPVEPAPAPVVDPNAAPAAPVEPAPVAPVEPAAAPAAVPAAPAARRYR